jgi:CubicO group peptidase (beta-lactamase class C family)
MANHPGVQRVASMCQAWANEDARRTVVVYASASGRVLIEQGFGIVHPLHNPAASRAARPDHIFLVASLTKPLTAIALCLLVERGQALLDDPVSLYLPSFSEGERSGMRLRHLLTHTSGLPDMLPENRALRAAHVPLAEFTAKTLTTPLLFTPGSDCRYQSMGILLAAAVVEKVVGISLPSFLEREVFQPLGMADTYLGVGHLPDARMVRVLLPPDEEAETDFHWNSPYWRALGAPWGGLHTTARGYACILELMLGGGALSGRRVLSPALVRAMLTNQLAATPGLADRVRLEQAWGLGWRLNQAQGAHGLPEIGSPRTFGHGGATGTVAWADPESGLACVILTNDPASGAFRSRLSNVVAALG